MSKLQETIAKFPEIGEKDVLNFKEIATALEEISLMQEVSIDALLKLRPKLQLLRDISVWARDFSKMFYLAVKHLQETQPWALQASLALVGGLSKNAGDMFDVSKEEVIRKAKISQSVLLILVEIQNVIASLESKVKKKTAKQKFAQLQELIKTSVDAQTEVQWYSHTINQAILGKASN